MRTRRTAAGACVAIVFALALARLSAQIIPGTNVNMVAGGSWPQGDPFLQRQNEPTVAVSSRNVLHLVAGSNDYRTVDLPGLPADKPTGDSWLGVFKSFDGGQTWRSTLLPGYPQDASSTGVSSPLKGLDAAADPVVRAGANGLVFYSGIAFQRAAAVSAAAVSAGMGDRPAPRAASQRWLRRLFTWFLPEADRREREQEDRRERAAKGKRTSDDRDHQRRLRGSSEDDDETAGTISGTASAVFVSTFVDLNNVESGDPIAYVRTALVDHDPGLRFLDKQWMAVDVPRSGAQMCVFDVPQ